LAAGAEAGDATNHAAQYATLLTPYKMRLTALVLVMRWPRAS
jgi:hypothetical protein